MLRLPNVFLAASLIVAGCTIETIKYRDRPTEDAGTTAMDAGAGDAGVRDAGGLDTGATDAATVVDAPFVDDAGACGVCPPGQSCFGGSCHECGADSDCPTRGAPHCYNGTCSTCADDVSCERFADTPACHGGTCTDCSATNHGSCSVNVACDVRTGRCSSFLTMSSTVCELCVSDAQCQPGQVCAPSSSASAAYGPVCLWRRDAGLPGAPSGDCNGSAPFGVSMHITSLDGVVTDVCGLEYATCRTLTRYGLACTDSTTCGTAGACTANRCTYSCSAPHVCPEDRACAGNCAF